MIILALETSCDETAAALVKDGTEILAHQVATSLPLHTQTGGIIPETAAREQLFYILPVVKEVLQQGLKGSIAQIDALAVTRGPGLIGSLLVGIETAKTLALVWQKKIVPVNHLQAHLYANWLEKKASELPQLPALGLIVSGGHTDLVKLTPQGLVWLGGTRDDAAGECFDKTARLLNLGYPGGPAIEKEAQLGKEANLPEPLPRPMINQDNLDFSFSGLKTAVLHQTKKQSVRAADLAQSVQKAIIEVLVKKSLQAVALHHPRSFLIGGGVAANQSLIKELRQALLTQDPHLSFFAPPPKFCTDNAAAIGATAYFHFQPVPPSSLNPDPNLTVVDLN